MFSTDASIAKILDVADDFVPLFHHVMANAEQFHALCKSASYEMTGDYKTTFFVNGLCAIICTWLDNNCAESAEQMNEIVMKEYRKLFEET